MKKIILLSFLLIGLLCMTPVFAQKPDNIVANVISTFNKSKSIKANIHISSNGQTHASGLIIMQRRQYYISTGSTKIWYNGKVQWTYSRHTGEVNIINPSVEDLQTTNPYSVITSFKNSYNGTSLKSNDANSYLLKFTPKRKNQDINEIFLTVNKRNYQLDKIVIVMRDKTSYTTTISNYKTGVNYPASTFVFNKKDVPANTPVVDLR